MLVWRMERYSLIDVVVTVTVILFAATLFLSEVPRIIKRATVAAGTAEAIGALRVPLSAYYALTGEWPADARSLGEYFARTGEQPKFSILRDVRIEDGAMHLNYNLRLPGKTLTLHPATPADDPLGPVRWIASAGGKVSGWTVIGRDATTVEDALISNILKR